MTTELREKIAFRAFQLYQQRGGEPGHELQDWVQAEHEVLSAGGGQQFETQRTSAETSGENFIPQSKTARAKTPRARKRSVTV